MATVMNRLAALILAATATVAVSGCSFGADSGEDKAGGSGAPVVLRLASTGGSIDQTPAVAYFVKRVDELSGGNVRIEVMDEWAHFASDAEQQVVRDVAAHKVDLGWVGTRAFDTLGVESFQALTAPMLIDSYALQNAVIDSGVTDEMLKPLDELGVVGLGVLADGLRRPIGVTAPLLGPADWRGVTFGTLRSNGHSDAIRSLGATAAHVFGPHREEAIKKGTIQGFELGMQLYSGPKWPHHAPYVTANVHLWPQMDVLLANPARLEELTPKQRGSVQEAAQDAADRSAALAGKEAHAVADACASGARFAKASDAALAALQEAFAPAYAKLQRDSETKAFIERIEALKQSTPREAGLSIPSDCTGKPPEQATSGRGTAPADLNGTYRYVITLEDARKADMVDPEESYPAVTTVILNNGDLEGGCFGSDGGTYAIEADRITFHSVEYGYDLTATFSRDDQGNLDLTPVPPSDPGDAFWCFSKPWTKID